MPGSPRSGSDKADERGDLLQRLARFNFHFGRFLRDAAGLTLLAAAILGLLAQFGVEVGQWLSPIWDSVRVWLGWGSYAAVGGLAFAGITLISGRSSALPWGRALGVEVAGLLALGILSALGGSSLVRADAGLDGGRLGWGIEFLFTNSLGGAAGVGALVVLFVLFITVGSGVWGLVGRRIAEIADESLERPAPTGIPEPEAPRQESSRPEKSKDVASESSSASASARPMGLVPEHKATRQPKPIPRGAGLPPLSTLSAEQSVRPDERTINQTAAMIMKTLGEFGIPATVIGYRVGPAVTQFAVQPGFIRKAGADGDDDAQQMKVRVAQIANLQKDLALALSAQRLRIEAPVPGKPFVGIEVPNPQASTVRLRPILESEAFGRARSPLSLVLGRDVSGHPLIADLGRMPHLLIAGATGSGKSVCVTSIAACLAMNNEPQDLRMIMIDSKMVELLRFNGLAHLLGKVETNLERILGVLRWVVVEMEHRYRLLEDAHVRDLESFNRKQARREHGKPLPRLVVLIDELADLMMSAPEQTEHNLVRLAQMARATGIHLVVATQRPSTDVVTGVIKANFPARLAFAVASGVDSRVILDTGGAETLLGKGDMLFLNPEVGNPIRAQGVMVGDPEIDRIIAFWQENADKTPEAPPWEKLLQEPDENEDEGLLEEAISVVRNSGRASASMLQRRLRIGYPRAARLLDQLEEAGVVGPSQGGGREREVIPSEEDDQDAA